MAFFIGSPIWTWTMSCVRRRPFSPEAEGGRFRPPSSRTCNFEDKWLSAKVYRHPEKSPRSQENGIQAERELKALFPASHTDTIAASGVRILEAGQIFQTKLKVPVAAIRKKTNDANAVAL
ncbi:hypothetical protein [Pararhizobium sp. O133]|uniref:hypothetical protein n=1 Tax=Pararhizobium sp. O133 TaxID=3449278 RepID=UPI003F688C3F